MANAIEVTGVWKNDGSYFFADDTGKPRIGEMTPAELLTAAVVGCTGKTMHSLLEKMKINHKGFAIAGLARKADGKPTRILSISVTASIPGATISTSQQVRLLELTEKYCLVTQTLQHALNVGLNLNIDS